MEAIVAGGGVGIPVPEADWSADDGAGQIGVPGRSFVPSMPGNTHSRPMATNRIIPSPPIESLRAMTDDEVVTLFQNGEREVYRVLVERYQERIRNLLFSIFHNKDVIDDLAQEVFIKAYSALPNFRFEASFYTWLYRIAVNKSRDELRKKKIRRFFSFQPLDEGIDTELRERLSVAPENRDTQELLALGLQTLPEKFRTAVVLKDIDGLSYEEIAEVMQCELGTVKSRISRARAMLRKALKPLLEEKRT
jgi:RNA polymerase sigma-70 factor (ECF subfamily)